MTIKNYAYKIRNKIDRSVLIKFDNNKKLEELEMKTINTSSQQLSLLYH